MTAIERRRAARDDAMRHMKSEGVSVGDIAAIVGLGRTRVKEILGRRESALAGTPKLPPGMDLMLAGGDEPATDGGGRAA